MQTKLRTLGYCLAIVGVLMGWNGMNTIAHDPTKQYDSIKEKMAKKTFTAADGSTLNYRLYLPDALAQKAAVGEDISQEAEKYPLVLFLHGAGERGSDNEKQLHWPEFLRFASDEASQPVILIAPQCPEGETWSIIPRLMGDGDINQPSAPMQRLLELLDEVDQTLPVKTDQRYVTGMSMGGFGSFAICAFRPGYFAAAMPICGGMVSPDFVKNYTGTAFRIVHGEADSVVPLQCSLDAVVLLSKNNISVSYIGYPNVNHNSWTGAFTEPDMLDWFFRQTRQTN